MLLFIILFFIVIFTLLIRDINIGEYKQRNPKFTKGDIVYHAISGSAFEIIKYATQDELVYYYPSFQYRPYTACFVKIIKLGKGIFGMCTTEDITSQPLAESALKIIKRRIG